MIRAFIRLFTASRAKRAAEAVERRAKAQAAYRDAIARRDTRDAHWRSLELVDATKACLRMGV